MGTTHDTISSKVLPITITWAIKNFCHNDDGKTANVQIVIYTHIYIYIHIYITESVFCFSHGCM